MYDNSQYDKHQSDWIYLEQGKSYYIRGDHGEVSDAQHFTVSVEIKPAAQLDNIENIHPKSTHSLY